MGSINPHLKIFPNSYIDWVNHVIVRHCYMCLGTSTLCTLAEDSRDIMLPETFHPQIINRDFFT